jgi:hypothetical protein
LAVQVLKVDLSFSCIGSDKLCLVIYVGFVGGVRFWLCQTLNFGAVSFCKVFGRFYFVPWQWARLIMAFEFQCFANQFLVIAKD